VLEGGKIAVPMKELAQIAKELPSAEIEMECKDNVVKISCGPAVLRLRGIEAEEFPSISFLEEGSEFNVAVSDFASMVDKTIFATSIDKARYILEGIKVDIDGSRLKFVATDGKRLSLVERAIESELGSPVSVLVPARAMGEVRRIVQGEGNIRVKVGEKKIEFHGEDFLVSSNLLVDNFPPFRQLIPSEFNISFQASAAEVFQSVRRASILVDDRTRMILFNISPEGIRISGESQAHGEAVTLIDVDYDGEPFRTGFRCEYLLDVLKVIEGDKIRGELKSPSSPTVVRDSKDPGFLHVLMPIKIEELAPEGETENE